MNNILTRFLIKKNSRRMFNMTYLATLKGAPSKENHRAKNYYLFSKVDATIWNLFKSNVHTST